MPKMQKKLGVTVFVSDITRVENYPDFDKLAHVIQHGLQWFIVKNIEDESTEANELSLCRSGSVAKIIPNFTNVFTKLNRSKGI